MAQPLAFSVVAALLTVGLLLLSRESQEMLQSEAEGSESDTAGTQPATAGRDAEQILEHNRKTAPSHTEANATAPAKSEGLVADGMNSPNRPMQADVTDLDPAGRPSPETSQQARQSPEIELTSRMVIANVAATQGLVAAIILAAGWYFAVPADAFGVSADPFSTGLPAVGLGVGFGFVLWLGNELSTTIADAVGAAYDEGVRELLAPDSAGGWALLFGIVLPLIAVAEELLFRAALIGVPAAAFAVSPWLLAVVASLAFALGHGAQGRVGVVVTGLLGFVLAAGYIVSGSLLLVVVAHYVINGLEFLVHEYLGIELFETL